MTPADKVVEEIRAMGGEAVASHHSVATPEGGRDIVETAVKAFGGIDVLINNAGILRDKTLVKMEPENWGAVMDVHLNGAYNVTRPAFIKMRESGYGRIVFTTSAAGLYGNFGQTNYSAAKMALVGFMNTLRLEGDKYNVKVNSVAPVAATRLTQDVMPPDLFEKAKPEYVAPLVLYLCSERCTLSGAVYNAGLGYFNRVALVTGPGIAMGDGEKVPTPEAVQAQWDRVVSLKEAREFPNAMAALEPMINAFMEKEKADTSGDEGQLAVKDVFAKMPGAFLSDKAAGVDVVFQFSISGPKGGEWHAVVKDQSCEVMESEHQSPTTTIKMADADFVKLITGELNAMNAFTTGKLKIGGDLMKSQLIEKIFKF